MAVSLCVFAPPLSTLLKINERLELICWRVKKMNLSTLLKINPRSQKNIGENVTTSFQLYWRSTLFVFFIFLSTIFLLSTLLKINQKKQVESYIGHQATFNSIEDQPNWKNNRHVCLYIYFQLYWRSTLVLAISQVESVMELSTLLKINMSNGNLTVYICPPSFQLYWRSTLIVARLWSREWT